MLRSLYLIYGLANYLGFLGVSLYLLAFLLDLGVPRSIDGPVAYAWPAALLVDLLLIGMFGLQHSVMARPTFKRLWTCVIPQPMERSTYVMFTNIALIVMFWQWRPFGPELWHIESLAGRFAMYVVFAIGWLTVLASTYMIHHFDLFGLRQTWLAFRQHSYEPVRFSVPGFYRLVRHPLYVGWTIVFWATPIMTGSHLLFAIGMTTYMLVAIYFEERNLVDQHGEAYIAYRRRTPMLIPRLTSLATHAATADATHEPLATSQRS
jgi:protein-S-isoprenylcysteine O-methyltransferase Ste14